MRRVRFHRLLLGCLLLLSLGVSSTAADTQRPVVQILTPTTQETYVTEVSPFVLSGTASDRRSGIARVQWATNRGARGLAEGTNHWRATVPLEPGTTRITVTAIDQAGNTRSDVLTVTYQTPAAAPVFEPVTVEWTWDGSGGDAFQLERCATTQAGCAPPPASGQPMEPVATLALTTRLWIDQRTLATAEYCYRLVVVTGHGLGPYSNILCSGS